MNRNVRLRRRKGFTIIEVTMALVILMIGLLAIVGLSATSLRTASRAGEEGRYWGDAQQVIDSIMALGFGLPVSGSTTIRGRNISWTVGAATAPQMVTFSVQRTGYINKNAVVRDTIIIYLAKKTRTMRPTSKARHGFTLVEILVAMTIAGTVMIGAYKLLNSQLRAYSQQVAVEDDGETLRGAAAMLGWEIHHAEMATDDIWSTSQDTLSVRSVQGVGVVCAIAPATLRYGIWKNGGDIQATSSDSALIYVQNTQLWKKLKITSVGTPAAMGMANCSWAGLRPPDIVVQVTVTAPSDTAGIVVGSIFRAFRRTKFAEYQSAGRWWLARSVDGGAWETITGPLLSPAQHGLQLTYHDSTGAATTDTSKLRMIGVALRAESYRRYKNSQGVTAYRNDSVITRVYIRR